MYNEKIINKILEDLDSMTLEEYEELYDSAIEKERIDLIDIESIDIVEQIRTSSLSGDYHTNYLLSIIK